MTDTTLPPNDSRADAEWHQQIQPVEVTEDVVTFKGRGELQDALRQLNYRACVSLVLRATKRVAVVQTYGTTFAECYTAGIAPGSRRWYKQNVVVAAADARAYAFTAAFATADETYAYVTYAFNAFDAFDTDIANDVWKVVSLDFARLKQLQSAQPPLTGWDDPRLGPLWPDGAPEWHKQLEREVAEMRAKLDARPDPFAPPIPDETRRKLDDHRKLNELGDQGAFKDCRGQYVFVYNGEFVGHGTELGEARRQAAEKLGVPPSSLVYRYVY